MAVAFLAEAALQLREWRSVREQHEQWVERDLFFELHPFLQIVPRPDARKPVRVNAFRFRGDRLEEERSGDALRVFALGGSTTLSWQVPYGRTYPAQLAKRLEARFPGRPIEMQNAACDWYTTEHSLIRYLFSVRRFEPDVVLLFHAVNDLYRSFSPEWFAVGEYQPDYSHYYGPLIRARRRLELGQSWFPFQQSLLVRALGGSTAEDRFDPNRWNPYDPEGRAALRAGLEAVPVDDFPSLAVFRSNLELIARTLRDDGVTLILANQPSLFAPGVSQEARDSMHFALSFASQNGRYPDFDSMVTGMRRFNAVTREVAHGAGVPFVDLAAAVAPTVAHFADDVHMTPDALSLVAREFEAAIVGAVE